MEEKAYRARFVRDLREELSCDQPTFAFIVGVSPAAVSRWENGKALIRDRLWEKLHDMQEKLYGAPDAVRQTTMLKMAISLEGGPAPIDLFLAGELEDELRERVYDLGLGPGSDRMEFLVH